MVCHDNTSADNNEYCHTSDDADKFTTPVALASQLFAIGILLVTCLFGNGLMIYAVVKTRRGTIVSASSLLLINLATADLLVGVLVLPMWMVSTGTLSWPMPQFLCAGVAFFTVTLMVCSILSLSAIAVDRYLILAYPLRYPTEVTSLRLVILLIAIWTFCFLVAGLPLLGWGHYTFQPQTVPICNPVWVTEVGFAIFLMLCGLTLPFVVMLIAYVRIVQIAKRHIAKIEATQIHLMGTLAATDSTKTHNDGKSHGRKFSHAWKRRESILEEQHFRKDADCRGQRPCDAMVVSECGSQESQSTSSKNGDVESKNSAHVPDECSGKTVNRPFNPSSPVTSSTKLSGGHPEGKRASKNDSLFTIHKNTQIGSETSRSAGTTKQDSNKTLTSVRKTEITICSLLDDPEEINDSQKSVQKPEIRLNGFREDSHEKANCRTNAEKDKDKHNEVDTKTVHKIHLKHASKTPEIKICTTPDSPDLTMHSGIDYESQKDLNQNQTLKSGTHENLAGSRSGQAGRFTGQPDPTLTTGRHLTSNPRETAATLSIPTLHRYSNGTFSESSMPLSRLSMPKRSSTVSIRSGLTSRLSGISLKRSFSKSVRTANRVFIAVGVFFLCWGPYVILNFWSVNNDRVPVPYSADLLTTLLAFANSSINPVLFLLINKDFRRRVRMLGRKWAPCLYRKSDRRQSGVAGSGWYFGNDSGNGVSVMNSEVEADDVRITGRREGAREGVSAVREAW